MMDNKTNLELLNLLLVAESEDAVTKIIEKNPVLLIRPNWRNLGSKQLGYDVNNFGLANTQQSSALSALNEKITNSIDSLLLQACKQRNIDPTSIKAPKDMYEASEQFFEIPGGDLENVDRKKIRELAEKIKIYLGSMLAEDQRNVWIVDSGEGQRADEMEKTFMSILANNKINIHFVQGRYNMGSLSALKFCGKKNYQLILTRRDPELLPGYEADKNKYGFTLVKRNFKPGDRNPCYEYCVGSDGKILTVDYDKDNPIKLNFEYANFEFKHGAVVKLFNYKFSKGEVGAWAWALERRIKKILFKPVLPFSIIGPKKNSTEKEVRAVDGNITRLKRLYKNSKDSSEEDIDSNQKKNKIFRILNREAELGLLGMRKIEIIILENKDDKSYTENEQLVFFTIFGQTHATLPASFIGTIPKLAELEKYLLIHIDCSKIAETEIRNEVFMSDRERLTKEHNEIIRNELRKLLVEDEELLDIAKQKEQEVQPQEKFKSDSHKLLSERFFRLIPEARINFEKGKDVISQARKKLAHLIKAETHEKLEKKEHYKGTYFPTFLRIRDWNNKKGIFNKNLPDNSYITLEFETDAANGYLERDDMPGEFNIICNEKILIKKTGERLYNGKLNLQLRAGNLATVGQVESPRFELTRYDDEPLVVDYVSIKIVEPKPIKDEQGRTGNQPDQPKEELPEPVPLTRAEWEKKQFEEDYIVKFGDNKIFINTSCLENPKFIGEYRGDKYDLENIRNNFTTLIYFQALALRRYLYIGSDTNENGNGDDPSVNLNTLNNFLNDYQRVLFIALPLNNNKLLIKSRRG